MHNPTQVETLSTLFASMKKAVKFSPHIYFPLYSIGIFILAHTVGFTIIFNLTKDLPFQLTIAIIPIVLTYFIVSRDVTRWKKNSRKENRNNKIALIIFIFIYLYVETIFFVIGGIELMTKSNEQIEIPEQVKLRFLQAHITSIALIYHYVIVTEGKQIWKWITKRDPLIDQINDKWDFSKNPYVIKN